MNKLAALSAFAVPLALMVAVRGADAAPCALPALRWLPADWHNTADPDGAQERWNGAQGSVLIDMIAANN